MAGRSSAPARSTWPDDAAERGRSAKVEKASSGRYVGIPGRLAPSNRKRGRVLGRDRGQRVGCCLRTMQQTMDRFETTLEHAETMPIALCDPQRPKIRQQPRLAVDERLASRPLAHPNQFLRLQVTRDDVAVMRPHHGRDREGIRLARQRQPNPSAGRVVTQQARADRRRPRAAQSRMRCRRGRASGSGCLEQRSFPIRISKRKMIAFGDFDAVHAVDHEEVAEHEGVGAVHRVERALQHAAPARRIRVARADSPAGCRRAPSRPAGTGCRCSGSARRATSARRAAALRCCRRVNSGVPGNGVRWLKAAR